MPNAAYKNPLDISIHSLRMEGDLDEVKAELWNKIFQSTPSAWRETTRGLETRNSLDISIHSLRMEGDSMSMWLIHTTIYFNPLPPHGGRPD